MPLAHIDRIKFVLAFAQQETTMLKYEIIMVEIFDRNNVHYRQHDAGSPRVVSVSRP